MRSEPWPGHNCTLLLSVGSSLIVISIIINTFQRSIFFNFCSLDLICLGKLTPFGCNKYCCLYFYSFVSEFTFTFI